METWAVLISGGLDSAIVLGDALCRQTVVHPIYVRCGLHWEKVELAHLHRFLDAVRTPLLRSLTILEQPVHDLYGDHWSITGRGVPAADTPDEAVFLPGRNVLLLGKTLLWCHLNQVGVLATGSLGTNPFPDAGPQFFADITKLVNRSVGGNVDMRLPLGRMKKKEVMRLGVGLPLELSFSCICPKDDIHCGKCNKCAERKQAFADAGMDDLTKYC
jgi:7-cyano-7-deazaguanine synthase